MIDKKYEVLERRKRGIYSPNSKKTYMEVLKGYPYHLIVYMLANTERRIFELTRGGYDIKRNLHCKKNALREELLFRLTDWKQNPQKYEVKFYDTINKIKQV